jgi:hypothetical protein
MRRGARELNGEEHLLPFNMKPTSIFLALRFPLLVGALLVPFAGAVWAQPDAPGERDSRRANRLERRAERGGEDGPGGRFGRGEDGAGRARRASAKRQLSGMWRGVERLEREAPLSKEQAARIVNLVRPWSTRPQMSESAAAQLQTQLAAVLTPAQREMFERPRREGRGGEGGPRGEGRKRGPRGEMGQGEGPRRERRPRGERGEMGGGREGAGMDREQRQALRGFMQNLNPFYAPTGYSEWKTLPQPMQERLSRRYNQGRTTLEALSRKARA